MIYFAYIIVAFFALKIPYSTLKQKWLFASLIVLSLIPFTIVLFIFLGGGRLLGIVGGQNEALLTNVFNFYQPFFLFGVFIFAFILLLRGGYNLAKKQPVKTYFILTLTLLVPAFIFWGTLILLSQGTYF